MIPRLIIAVILVNISYYICLLAVDISNVLGYGAYEVFNSIGGTMQKNPGKDGSWEVLLAGLLVTGLAGAALALTLSIPVIIMSLLALLMIAFILIARQALIILLIVLAPLAFVAYLLPNTEDLYKKWQKMFIALLMVFPVVGLVFGASKLASTIIQNSGIQLADVMALAVLAIPLFAVPAILKASLSAAGSIGNKLANIQDKATGAAKRSGSKNAKERWGNTSLARGMVGRRERKQKYRDRRFNAAVAGEDTSLLGKARQRASMGLTGGVVGPITNAGKFSADRAEISAAAGYDKDFQEDVSGAMIMQRKLSHDDRLNMGRTGELNGKGITEAERTAAIRYGMTSGNFAEQSGLLKGAGSLAEDGHTRASQELSEQYYKNGLNAVYGSAYGDALAQGKTIQFDETGKMVKDGDNLVMNENNMNETGMEDYLNTLAIANIKDGKVKAETLADGHRINYIQSTMKTELDKGQGSRLNGANVSNVVSAVDQIDNTPQLLAKKSEVVQKGMDAIRKLQPNSVATETQVQAKSQPQASTQHQPQANSRADQNELKIEHNKQSTSPQSTRTSAPPNTSDYQQRPSGLYVPPTAGESPNPPAQPPNSL